MPTKTKHADILRRIRLVCTTLPLDISFEHIKAHQDDSILYHLLDRMSQLNVDCDTLAKVGLVRLFRVNKSTSDVLPHEQIVVQIQGKKITGDVAKPLSNEISR